jgi:macrolide-specific efflux system membrane fusion protein
MKQWQLIVKLVVGLLALGLCLWGVWHWAQTPKPLQDTYTEVTIKKGDIQTIVTAQGKAEPKSHIEVGARVSGQLEKLHIDVGDRVEKGDLIAEIDAEIFEAEVSADEARLKTMLAQEMELNAELQQAQRKLERNQKLIEKKAISVEALEDSEFKLDMLRARELSLRAQIDEAKSTLEGKKTNLNYTKIYAPVSGTVVSLDSKEGQTLNANQTTPIIAKIADLDRMIIRARVSEADIHKISEGMDALYHRLSTADLEERGTVSQILPTPQNFNNVVFYDVLITADNRDRTLMSGMTVQVSLVVESLSDVLVIPTHALLRRASEAPYGEDGHHYNIMMYRDGKFQEHIVQAGASDRNHAQVIAGLSVGDVVGVPDGSVGLR